MLGLAVTTTDLAGVTDLTLDGDRVIYGAIWNYWWDLGDHFVIRDLSGLEACPNLGKLHLGQGLVDGASLGPLLRLPALRDLALCHTGAFRDLEVLGQLKLERIWATNVPVSDQRWAVLPPPPPPPPPPPERGSVSDVSKTPSASVRAGGDLCRRSGSASRDTRFSMAAPLVTTSSLSIDEVAERLGYAESKAFRRAFRRWTGGVSPARLRGSAPRRP